MEAMVDEWVGLSTSWVHMICGICWTLIFGCVLLMCFDDVSSGRVPIDPSALELSPGTAALIGIGSLAVGWVVDHQLCKSHAFRRASDALRCN